MAEDDDRRAFLAFAGAGLLLGACGRRAAAQAPPSTPCASAPRAPGDSTATPPQGEDVGATEDLMREHGVIRRILTVYRESAARLRVRPASIPPEALQKAALLMRTFGEDYHERQLEEAHIFPVVTVASAGAATTVGTLVAQHRRGREITEYVLAITRKTIGAAAAGPLAQTLEAFARMYEEHTAIEDTVVFPAWKKALTPKQLDEAGDLFEDIEHKTFGKDGFDDAVVQVAAIEATLGVELSALTAPPPPHP
jgi:hemerythrin-like domain-containing protein